MKTILTMNDKRDENEMKKKEKKNGFYLWIESFHFGIAIWFFISNEAKRTEYLREPMWN